MKNLIERLKRLEECGLSPEAIRKAARIVTEGEAIPEGSSKRFIDLVERMRAELISMDASLGSLGT